MPDGVRRARQEKEAAASMQWQMGAVRGRLNGAGIGPLPTLLSLLILCVMCGAAAAAAAGVCLSADGMARGPFSVCLLLLLRLFVPRFWFWGFFS